MARNDERKTTANAVIVRLDDNMQATVEEVTIEVPYTRVPAKAAASIREQMHLGPMDSVMVKEPLVQQEYERRVYDAHAVFTKANESFRAYGLDKNGSPYAVVDEDTAALNRIVVDVYTYVITGLFQREDGSYFAAKIYADNITECRSGIGSAQGYAMDVLSGKHTGRILAWNYDGTSDWVEPGENHVVRAAAWDNDSKMRIASRFACYLTNDELAAIPYTVYKRGDGNNGDGDTDK